MMEENQKPIYQKIEDYITSNIKSSQYAKGMMIPSEEEFCKLFNTSRMTVRKSLDSLVSKGYLHKVQGRGTFVSQFNFEKTMNSITGWKETMQAAGFKTKSTLLKMETIKANEKVAKNLNIKMESDVIFIERLRYADGIPILIEHTFLNASMYPDFNKHAIHDFSLYDIIEKEYHLPIHHAYQKIRTQKLEKRESNLLFSIDDASVMVLENVSFDTYTRPLEFTISYIDGEKYALRYVAQK